MTPPSRASDDEPTVVELTGDDSDHRRIRLSGELAGYHATRVNDQYRVVFRFEGTDAYDVRCTDYH